MVLNGGTVVRADVDVDTQNFAGRLRWVNDSARLNGIAHVQQRKHGCTENQRPTMRNTRLDDQIRLDAPDEFLHRNDILRVLNDRAILPVVVVRILRLCRGLQKCHSQVVQRLVVHHVRDTACDLLLKFSHFPPQHM